MSSFSDTIAKTPDTVADFPDIMVGLSPPTRKRERTALATSSTGAYLWVMRTLLLTALLILVPAAALAACVPAPTTESRAENLANQRALTLCQAQELHDATARRSQQLQLQADLQALQQNFQAQLKMQQTFAAASNPSTFSQF
jgi:hypothetical protein